jgi:hypothetical protein
MLATQLRLSKTTTAVVSSSSATPLASSRLLSFAREQAEQLLLADQLEFAAHTPVLTSRALPSLQPTIATCDCLVTIASSVRLVLKYTYKNLHVNLMPHLYG